MSVDIYIAPRFGWLGQFLYRRFDWPDIGDGTNLATQSAIANFCANIYRHATRHEYPSVFALFEKGYVAGRRFERFPAQWRALEQHFARVSVSELVCVVMEGEPFEGSMVSREEDALTVTFSPTELANFIRENNEFAARMGMAEFETRTLRDAFFIQFNELSRFLPKAITDGRGLLLE